VEDIPVSRNLQGVPPKSVTTALLASQQWHTAKNPKAYEAAVKQANKALESAEFRAWLAKHAEKGLEMAKDAGSAKALEFKFLLDALRRLQ